MSGSTIGGAKVGDGLAIIESSENVYDTLEVHLGTDNWNEDTLDPGSWKTPYVRASVDDGQATVPLSLNNDNGVYLSGCYQAIPEATPDTSSGGQVVPGNDGYMSKNQANALVAAMMYLTWEE